MTFIHRFLPAILLVLLAFSPTARANESVEVLKPGESLTYRVGWGLLGHAGDMKVTATEETIAGRSHTRMTTTSATQGFVRLLYRFDGEAQMLFDAHDGRLLNATATTQAKKNKTNASITFDYTKNEASYVDHLEPARNSSFPMPEGMPMDFITSLIQTRSWALEPGQSRDVLVLFDKDFYQLRITAEREETISTPSGKRKTVLLMPRMIGEPKGMFRRGGEVRVWVSADADRLPLRFEVKLKVGTAYAVLTDYQPPAKP
ncbi:DUF3108 domain-containing protein [Rariglobus hedericola]|uniref:DUF3108 domain-containing protein n=1 Tax=Rariglobus hedericola TaxID=2597822 RepID=A0A556QNC6_9BACT|nr:DUF3108 domain-containing protein [Rariglobus hedericola]TSJ78135.1 DUF3108 domain-containing protein [Rariglobus hedericola]